MDTLRELKKIYKEIAPEIKARLGEFRQLIEGSDDYAIYKELIFCLLTPQSKARVCWQAVCRLDESGFLLRGTEKQVRDCLVGVRFKNNKARYILEARNRFVCPSSGPYMAGFINEFEDVLALRKWLVKNVKGLGYKEASHFLRNIGLGENLAILDRHILKNLRYFGVIEEAPSSLTAGRYMEIEEKMREFSDRIGIPMDELDLLLWYKEAGEVFK